MATAGSIVLDLLFRTGSFETDTARAAKSLKSLQKSAEDFAIAFKASFAGNLIAGAVQELVAQLAKVPGAFHDLIESAADFKRVGEVIGAASDDVAGFSLALAASGTPLQSLEEFSVKLTKALSQVDDESKKAGQALAAIGLNLADFKTLNPAQQIDALSQALAKFDKNDPGRTAVLEALARGGAQLLPFLKQLEEQGGRQNILTKEQIELADEFTHHQARSAATLKAYAQVVATDALPAITALQGAFVDLIKQLISTDGQANQLTANNAVQKWAESAAFVIAAFVDDLRATANEIRSFVATTNKEFASINLFRAQANAGPEFVRRALGLPDPPELKAALDERNKAVAESDAALAAKLTSDANLFQNLVKRQFDTFKRGQSVQGNAFTDPRSTLFGKAPPKIDTSGLVQDANGPKDDPTKKLLENQLKALDAVIKREQDLMTRRNRAITDANALGLVSIQAYYDAQIAIIDASTSAQLDAIDKQIKAVQDARKKATRQTDQAELEGKLQELIEKRSKVQEEADDKAIEAAKQRTEAEKRYHDQIEATRASVLELQGDLAGAAAIRFDQANAELVKRAFAEGDAAAKSLIDTLRKATIAQAEYNKQQADAQRITESLANQEDRIAISRQLGATTELGALKQLGEARQAAVAQLESIVSAQERIALASGNPALIQSADKARVELEKLKAVADPLADKFRSIFEDAGATGIEAFINDVTKGKDALKAFADSVVQQLNKIASQQISESIFGKGGVFGGLADQAASLFGVTKAPGAGSGAAGGAAAGAVAGASADAAAATATGALATSATAGATAMAALTAAAQAAAAALTAVSGSSGAGAASDFIDLGAFFEEGGSPPVGKVSVGGEGGAEMWFPGTKTPAETSAAIVDMVTRSRTMDVDGLTLIGRDGPQLFRPRVPGYVVPSAETARILGRFPGLGGRFAGGGSPPVGRSSLGGEYGTEMFVPTTAGRAPPPAGRSTQDWAPAMNVTQNFTVQGTPDRRTQQQIAAQASRGLANAQRDT